MNLRTLLCATAFAALIAQPAIAAPPKPQPGDPIKIGGGFSFDPIIEGRLRYEHVDQPTTDADALTMRLRAGGELKHSSGLSLLAEGEGVLAVIDHYNAFPFAITSNQRRTAYSVVADPMTVGLNRLQLQYKSKPFTLTVGRQRINLDDQRWVGSVGWRQDEQTFDAVRAEATVGPISLDGTYSISQRTIFGFDAGPRQAYGGDFIMLGAGAKLGQVNVKGFAYLLDYNEAFFFANSSQTYGARATSSLTLAPKTKLNLAASYASQSSYGTTPFKFAADYIAGEAGLGWKDLTLTAGYEKLGSDGLHAVQTPMATLHKFDGWADLFLTTPAGGIQDYYGGAAIKFPKVKALPGLNAAVTYHQFDSDKGGMHYGNEWDASIGFKIKRLNLLAKYADYKADKFGASTKKLWLQLEFAY